MELSERTKNYVKIVREQLEKLGVLEKADEENLKFLAEQTELYNRAMDELDRTGLTILDNKGKTVVNPVFQVSRSAMTQITALMKELSVSCRQRRILVKDNFVQEDDAMDLFLQSFDQHK